MPVVLGVPGFALTKQQRIVSLIEGVGGPVRAATISGLSRTTIRNWRQDGADPPMGAIRPLCEEAGVSLDWVETGYQVRPDIAALSTGEGLADQAAGGFEGLPGFVRLLPFKPELVEQGGHAVERWTPSELAVSQVWLDQRGLTSETARYAVLRDDAMLPRLERGALVILDVRPAKPKAGVYLVELDGDAVARRFRRMPDGAAELVADADPSWRWPVPAGDAVVLHRIVWAGHDL